MKYDEKPLRLWTGCELYMPMTISMDGMDRFVVRCPTHGDSFGMPIRTGFKLKDIIKDIEAGESFLSWQVMGWAVCTRRNRWMRAANARRKP